MTTKTVTIHEQGNGFPGEGDDVFALDIDGDRIDVGDHVATVGLIPDDSDVGIVREILSADEVLVAWSGGTVDPCPVSRLRIGGEDERPSHDAEASA